MSPNLKACWDSWTGAVPRLKQPGYVTREARAGSTFGAEETGKEEPVDNNLEKKESSITFSPGDFVVGELNFP